MSILEKFDTAVKLSIDSGNIDGDKQGPLIEAARKVARLMDKPEWPLVNDKIDNVSASVFLKYCEKLGIAPDVTAVKEKTDKNAKLHVIGNSKWKKQA